jgi:aspartate oxidase
MNPDFLVIGAGGAGLRAAIELGEAGSVLVVAKESLQESSSEYARGGIAVALSGDDEVSLHEQDTLYAGDGLCDRALARAESRGAHFRTDFPVRRAEFQKHSVIDRNAGVRFQ